VPGRGVRPRTRPSVPVRACGHPKAGAARINYSPHEIRVSHGSCAVPVSAVSSIADSAARRSPPRHPETVCRRPHRAPTPRTRPAFSLSLSSLSPEPLANSHARTSPRDRPHKNLTRAQGQQPRWRSKLSLALLSFQNPAQMWMLNDMPRLAGPTPLVKPLGPSRLAPSSGTIETCRLHRPCW